MNLRSFKVAAAAIAMVGMVFTGCSGEDGSEGPAGVSGANGNANVIANTYTKVGTDWSGGNLTIDVPQLSKSIADNGSVAVYFTFDSLTTDTISWEPLPYRFVGNVGGANTFITMSYGFQIGEVSISARTTSNGGVNFNQETNYRVVLIPSNAKMEGVNLDDYEAVKAVYGIKEYDFN